jgi:hypothetical protein
MSRFGSARILTAACGICSIAWAISSLSTYRTEGLLASYAQHILSGESFSAQESSGLRDQLDTTRASSLRSLALANVAVVRLRLAESELKSGKPQIVGSDLAVLEMAVTAALAGSPTNSFLWLTEYWLQRNRAGTPEGNLKYLRISYLSGPNEGWIAVKRNPLAMSAFSSLPPELVEQVLSEFVGLVRSRLFLDASNILAGPGWAVREKLLHRLVQVKEADRRAFAKVLESRNLDGALVPGMGEPSSRPF